MRNELRKWLARKLYPDVFEEVSRLRYMHGQIADLHRWCGEFPDIAAGTTWVFERVRSRYCPSADQYAGAGSEWRQTISDFREQLRKRRVA